MASDWDPKWLPYALQRMVCLITGNVLSALSQWHGNRSWCRWIMSTAQILIVIVSMTALVTQILVNTWSQFPRFPLQAHCGGPLSVMTSLSSTGAFTWSVQRPKQNALLRKVFASLWILPYPIGLWPMITYFNIGTCVILSLMTSDFDWICDYPMKTKDEAHKDLSLIFQSKSVPPTLWWITLATSIIVRLVNTGD